MKTIYNNEFEEDIELCKYENLSKIKPKFDVAKECFIKTNENAFVLNSIIRHYDNYELIAEAFFPSPIIDVLQMNISEITLNITEDSLYLKDNNDSELYFVDGNKTSIPGRFSEFIN